MPAGSASDRPGRVRFVESQTLINHSLALRAGISLRAGMALCAGMALRDGMAHHASRQNRPLRFIPNAADQSSSANFANTL